jgi:maltose O-acetyltransferase
MFRALDKEFTQWKQAFLEAVPGKTGEYLRNRLYGYVCGKRVRVLKGVVLHHPTRLKIGDFAGISSGTQINAAGGVQIGNNVLIGPHCIIWSQNHRYEALDIEIRKQGYEYKSVVIEDDVWIGASSVILPGVTLMRGTVVAAGAVVVRSTTEGVVVAGIPAKPISSRRATV